MSSQRDLIQPPPVALWLVTLFTRPGEAESILGDLLEEFSHLVLQSGAAFAQRWYWRQSLKTIAHLISAGFRTAPWTITAIAVGGFLLRWFGSWLSNPAVNRALEAVLEKYQVYAHDPHAYIFWYIHSMYIERFVVNALTGVVVAAVAKEREMVATMALALLGDALAIQAVWMTFARTGDHGLLWTLPWSFAFSIAIVAGGVAVRRRRSASCS
jgi:hypothetical protein